MDRFIIIVNFIACCLFFYRAATVRNSHWTDYMIAITFAVIALLQYIEYRLEKERIKRRTRLFNELLQKNPNDFIE
jgi:F0F1-type ATP synthase membrane subunit a